MPRKKLSPKAPCPCGSGKKYGRCCHGLFDEAQATGEPKRKQRLTSIFARIEGLLAVYYTDKEPE